MPTPTTTILPAYIVQLYRFVISHLFYKIALALLFVSVIILNIFQVHFGMDYIVITFCALAILMRESKQFLKDWLPPILLFYIYEVLRAWANDFAFFLGIPLIAEGLIELERKLFFFLPEIPPVMLQNALNPDFQILLWYDYVLFFFYIMFFWFWLGVGFLLWQLRRPLFKPYIYGLVGFSLFNTVFFYAFFPTAPPWWAAEQGMITYIERVFWTQSYFPGMDSNISMVSIYGHNDFAAFPSHHVAWPFFACLFLLRGFGHKVWPVFLIPLIIAFGTWYGAEHYIIDSIAGFAVAWLAYRVAVNWDVLREKIAGYVQL